MSKGKIMTFSDKIETVKNELTLKEQLMNVIQEEKNDLRKRRCELQKKCEKKKM